MKPQPRVTLRQIAKTAGVSHSTISLCLRNHPSIPETTRERIVALAKEMGYRPDPMLTSLNYYRQQRSGYGYHSTLAWLNGYRNRKLLRSNPDFNLYWSGARERAEQIGYEVEEFWLHEPNMSSERLDRIFKNRQIQGLLLPPQPQAHDQIQLPWEDYSVVAYGYSHEPLFNLVTSAQYRGARLAVRRLYDLGYRSVAMFSWPDWEERTDFNYSSGYRCECENLKIKPAICKVADTLPDLGGQDERILQKWTRQMNGWMKTRPLDALLMPDPTILGGMLRAGLEASGKGLAVLSHYGRDNNFSGLCQNPKAIGAEAVNQLVSLIQRNERGKPECPLRILVEGYWVEGESTPARKL
ncbi:MAG: LacI family DNA-binding transcriptional regulator [Puniceicoccales bacterium]